jgi:hypothetical protein
MQRKLLALQPFARKEIEQMLDAFHLEHRRKREAAGLTALSKAYKAALCAWGKSRRRMVSTAPRTPRGAAALAEVLFTFEYAGDGDLERGCKPWRAQRRWRRTMVQSSSARRFARLAQRGGAESRNAGNNEELGAATSTHLARDWQKAKGPVSDGGPLLLWSKS